MDTRQTQEELDVAGDLTITMSKSRDLVAMEKFHAVIARSSQLMVSSFKKCSIILCEM